MCFSYSYIKKNVNYGLVIIIRFCHWLIIHDDKTVISYYMPSHQTFKFSTYDKFTLFHYFGQRPFSRKNMHFSINYIVSVPPFWICLYWCVTSRWHERNATTSHRFSRKSGKKYMFHAHPYQAWNPSCSQVPKFVFSYLFAWQHNTWSPETNPLIF